MREVLSDIDRWLAQGKSVALATVVKTWGSAPRREGAKMALTPEGDLSGSVSGGCVEGAVYEEGVQALREGRPRLLHFGVADETAWEVGLACGGTIEVFVEPLDPAHYRRLRDLIAAERGVAVATVVRGPEAALGRRLALSDGERWGDLAPPLEGAAEAAAREALANGKPRLVELEGAQVFVDVVPPPPTLVMVGGVHIAIALAQIAKALGYRTVVVDPRRAFGNPERFPHVDRLIQAWPQEAFAELQLNENTAVATLTHDPKIDDPALQIALASPAFYVGALGSAKTQARRRERLAAAGLPSEALARLRGPIGLDLGGQTPEEIAVAIMAEIVAARHERLPVGERMPR